MTRAQRMIILAGTALLLASGLYPPWRMVRAGYGTPVLVTIKYGWVFDPPHVWQHRQLDGSERFLAAAHGNELIAASMYREWQAANDTHGPKPQWRHDIVPWSQVEPRLDLYRIGFEWVLIALVATGLCLASRQGKSPDRG